MERMLFIEATEALLLDEINKTVVAIRALQEVSDGSVILRMMDCGKKCNSCPHPRWEKWVGGGAGRYRWHRVKVAYPLKAAKGKFFPNDAREAIKHAVKLLEYREKLSKNAGVLTSLCTRINGYLGESSGADADGEF